MDRQRRSYIKKVARQVKRVGVNVWADMINSAVQEVNFYEIAENMVTDYLTEASYV